MKTARRVVKTVRLESVSRCSYEGGGRAFVAEPRALLVRTGRKEAGGQQLLRFAQCQGPMSPKKRDGVRCPRAAPPLERRRTSDGRCCSEWPALPRLHAVWLLPLYFFFLNPQSLRLPQWRSEYTPVVPLLFIYFSELLDYSYSARCGRRRMVTMRGVCIRALPNASFPPRFVSFSRAPTRFQRRPPLFIPSACCTSAPFGRAQILAFFAARSFPVDFFSSGLWRRLDAPSSGGGGRLALARCVNPKIRLWEAVGNVAALLTKEQEDPWSKYGIKYEGGGTI